MEIFPTSIRQSGIGFATLISQTISIGGPYVIYLGATDLKLPYMIMFLICLVGSISVCMLPETLGSTLPETIVEANVFGKQDKVSNSDDVLNNLKVHTVNGFNFSSSLICHTAMPNPTLKMIKSMTKLRNGCRRAPWPVWWTGTS